MLALAACDSSSGREPEPTDPGSEKPGFGVDFTDPDATYEGRLLVVNPGGDPLPAQLTVEDDRSFATDDEGRMAISDLPAGKTVNARLVADGYVPRTVALSFGEVGQSEKRIVLNEVTVLATVKSREGGEVAATSTSVTFKQNSVTHADGTPYDGEVVVAMGSHDPASLVLSDYESGSSFKMRDDFDYDRVPTGYLVAKKADGKMAIHYPEATFSVDLTDPSGEPLAIDPNKSATFTMKLPSITRRLPGDVVDVYTFDETDRQWVPDGTCTVEAEGEEGLSCKGAAKHFSARSISTDSNGTTYCEQFRVQRKNWPAGTVMALSSESDQSGTWTRAEVNELGAQGLCHVSGVSKARLKIVATTSDGKKYVLTRASSAQEISFSQSDMSALTENQSCPKCLVHVIVADWSAMAALTDADKDGYFAGDEVNPDCNDANPAIHPNAAETYCTSVDANCDGKAGAGWISARLADAKAAGVAANEWNNTVCKLSCVLAEKAETINGENAGWDENCDGLLGCPMGTSANAQGLCVAIKSCGSMSCGANATCEQVSAIETRCVCNVGYVGQDGTCLPQNPCATANGGCAQTCTPSGTTATCSCGDGYQLNADKKRCDANCSADGSCNALCNGADVDCAPDAGIQADSGITMDAGVQPDSSVPPVTSDSGAPDSIDATTSVPEAGAGGGGSDADVSDSGTPTCAHDDFCNSFCGDEDPDCLGDAGPNCSMDDVCNDICGLSDPDCTFFPPDAGGDPGCGQDGFCNPECGGDDFDCFGDAGGPGGCGQDGFCNPGCGGDDIDCFGDDAGEDPGCGQDGFCNPECGDEDIDCSGAGVDAGVGGPDCSLDGFCNSPCGGEDPDCSGGGTDAGAPDCSPNGFCNDICGLSDPDCGFFPDAGGGPDCSPNGFCESACGLSDPDCGFFPDAGGGPDCSPDGFCEAVCGIADPDCGPST